eukprot:1014873_1
MSMLHVLLIAYCIISVIPQTTANRPNSTFTLTVTNTTSIILPNDNIGDDRSSLLISTFFDLLWYIIGLFVFCICCISCLLLFYLQQTRKYDNKIQNQISVCQALDPKITNTNSTPPSTYTRSSTNTTSNGNKIYTISPPPNNIKNEQIASSISNSQSSYYTKAHGKSNNINPYSLSAFSGVDSQGVDIDDNATNKTDSVFNNLGPIEDEFEPSSTKSSKSEPQPTQYDIYVKNNNTESAYTYTEKDDTSRDKIYGTKYDGISTHTTSNNDTEGEMSSESSVYSNEQ